MTERPSPAALEAVADLLVVGEQHGIGVTFTPDDVGWEVGYMQGMGGGDLSSAYDLETAAKAALRPLMELAAELEVRRAEKRGPSGMQYGPTSDYGEG
jgi:hypothetical protein